MRKFAALVAAILASPIRWTWDGLQWLLAPAPVVSGESAVETAATELADVAVETAKRDLPTDLPTAGSVAYQTAIAHRAGCAMPDAQHLAYHHQCWLNSLSDSDMQAILASRSKDLDAHIAGKARIAGLSQVLSMSDYLARQEAERDFLEWHGAAVDEVFSELLAECDQNGWSQTG